MELRDTIASVLTFKGCNVWSVTPETLVYDAVEMMSTKQVGALLVLTGDKLCGVVSERDYARKVILQGKSSKHTQVSEIMSSPVITVTPDQTVDDCMRIMTDRRIRHLPVVERGNVAGIISIGDLVRWIISAHEQTIFELHSYITGTYPR
jgi:CBS domain-containing protein